MIAVQVEPAGLPWTIARNLVDMLYAEAVELEGLNPRPRHAPPREPTPEDLDEAERLYDIARELEKREAAA